MTRTGIDRLMRRPGGDQDMLAGQRPGFSCFHCDGGAKHGLDPLIDIRRLGQPPGPKFAAGHRAFVGLQHGDAVGLQLLDVPLRRGMLPHADVHRRGDDNRLVGRQQQGRREIVGIAAAIRASRSAVAGQTSTRSAARLSWMWPISASSFRSHSEV